MNPLSLFTEVVQEGEYWRMLAASVSHISIMHLVFNMVTRTSVLLSLLASLLLACHAIHGSIGLALQTRSSSFILSLPFFLSFFFSFCFAQRRQGSLWSLSTLEAQLGTIEYLKITVILLVLSMAAVCVITKILVDYWGQERQQTVYSLGYSCVVFGLMTISSMLSSQTKFSMFGMFEMPMWAAPFGSLIFTSLIIPNASFIGHLAGIIAGFFISFHFFVWYSNYLFLCSMFWLLVLTMVSVKKTTTLTMPWLQMDGGEGGVGEGLARSSLRARPELHTVSVVGGRIVYRDLTAS